MKCFAQLLSAEQRKCIFLANRNKIHCFGKSSVEGKHGAMCEAKVAYEILLVSNVTGALHWLVLWLRDAVIIVTVANKTGKL